MSLKEWVSKNKIFSKTVAGLVIATTIMFMYIQPDMFDNNNIKEILMFILGGATGLLFSTE